MPALTRQRIVVADDSGLMRRVVSHALEQEGFEVVGAAADGDEALALCQRHRPDGRAARLERVGRSFDRRRVAIEGRLTEARELRLGVLEVGIDQLVHEARVAAGDLEQPVHGVRVQHGFGHARAPISSIPATA